MPSAPKWMNDAVESLIANKLLHGTVEEVVSLSANVKKIVLTGDFSDTDFKPGYAISFRVNERDYRNYTPSLLNKEKGLCEMIFHLHGGGPGSSFVAALKTGDAVKMIPPRGKHFYQSGKVQHFFFGDETSLGTCLLLAEEAKARGEDCFGILELDAANEDLPALLELEAVVVSKTPHEPGKEAVEQLLNWAERLGDMKGETGSCLTGNGHSMQAVRKAIRRMNWPGDIKSQAYWMEGKKGL